MENTKNASLKIMYLNPVGFSSLDQVFADMAKEYKEEGTEVHITSLNPSVGQMNNLEYRTFESFIHLDTLKAVRQASLEGFDAIIIGCFYDPVIEDAREIAGDMVVLGPCEASCQVAVRIANNFSVLIGRRKWYNQMNETIKRYGYGEKIASFRELSMTVPEFVANPSCTKEEIIKQAKIAVEEDKAECIILGCTCEIGHYKEVQEIIGVPVIDPSIAALKTAESAAGLKKISGWGTSKKWGLEPPSEEDLKAFGILQDPYVFGNRIIVN